jgi:hypothetical protein
MLPAVLFAFHTVRLAYLDRSSYLEGIVLPRFRHGQDRTFA